MSVLFCLSTGIRCLHECKIECDHRELFSLLAQITTQMWVIFPTTHDAELTPRCRWQVVHHVMLSFDFRRLYWTREDLWCHQFCSYRQLLPPGLEILLLLLLLGCDLFVFTQPSEENILRSVNRGSQFTQPGKVPVSMPLQLAVPQPDRHSTRRENL